MTFSKQMMVLAAALALTVGAASGDPMPPMPGMGGDQPMVAPDGAVSVTAGALTISGVSAPETPGGNGAVYLTIANAGPADRLIGGKSDLAAAVELHTMSMTGGMMEMRKVDALDVPANGSVAFEPHGNHIMLIGLKAPLKAGITGMVTLVFEHQGEVPVPISVSARGVGGDSVHH